MDAPKPHRNAGLSLTELLCVIAIIAVLGALYLSTISKALTHVFKFLKGFGS
jgi:prepilin-type N-terminal cleavage/methylation domain-containing protein